MANHQSHISFSVLIGLVYAVVGVFVLGTDYEVSLLSFAVVVIAGMIPNIDSDGPGPSREVGGLIAAVAPIALIEFYPALKSGGMIRMTLIVAVSYAITRVIVVRALQKLTVHRGMLHSIPASVIAFEAVYLVFSDVVSVDRVFIAGAAFSGYMAHLFLDAYSNLDIVGKAMGGGSKKAPVMKLVAQQTQLTILTYALLVVLGWYVARDFYPGLGIDSIKNIPFLNSLEAGFRGR